MHHAQEVALHKDASSSCSVCMDTHKGRCVHLQLICHTDVLHAVSRVFELL